jgi:uncharacterized membrane protein YgcG
MGGRVQARDGAGRTRRPHRCVRRTLVQCWWRARRQAGVLLVAVPLMLLAAPVPAGAAAAAAASSHSAPDRAPGEVALLGVCCAVLIAVAAAVVRRGRARRWLPGRALVDVVRASRRTGAEEAAVGDGPDDARVCDTRPDLAQLDDLRAGCAEDAEPAVVVDGDSASGFRWHPQTGVLVPAAAVILLACGMSMAVVIVGSRHSPASHGSAAAGLDPGPGQLQTASASATTSPQPGKHPANGTHAAASSGPRKYPSNGTAAAASGSGSGSSGTSGATGSGASGAGGGGTSGAGSGGTSGAGSGPPAPATLDGLPSSPVACTGLSPTA